MTKLPAKRGRKPASQPVAVTAIITDVSTPAEIEREIRGHRAAATGEIERIDAEIHGIYAMYVEKYKELDQLRAEQVVIRDGADQFILHVLAAVNGKVNAENQAQPEIAHTDD